MQLFIRYFVNIIYILVIVFVVLSLSAYAFISKDAKITSKEGVIVGKVVKEEIPLQAKAPGFINSINKKVGDKVSTNETVLYITSDKTEEDLDETSASSSAQIMASTEGTIQKILVKRGQGVKKDQAVASIVSDENILVLLNVDEEGYKKIKSLKNIYFYSNRLDQSFAVETSLLNPSVLGVEGNANTFQLSFTFKNPKESTSLLHNEKVDLLLPKEEKGSTIESFLSKFRK